MDPPFDGQLNGRRLMRQSPGGTIGRMASTSTTWQWEGSRRVAEQAMSLFFILAPLSSARVRMSLELRQTTVKEDWLVPEVERGCSHLLAPHSSGTSTATSSLG